MDFLRTAHLSANDRPHPSVILQKAENEFKLAVHDNWIAARLMTRLAMQTAHAFRLTSPLKSAVLSCRAALANGDFEAAAEHVSKYLHLDRQFSDVTDELDSHQLQEQRAVSSAACFTIWSSLSVLANPPL